MYMKTDRYLHLDGGRDEGVNGWKGGGKLPYPIPHLYFFSLALFSRNTSDKFCKNESCKRMLMLNSKQFFVL